MLLADLQTYLPNDLLTKVDIATMAVSLEARSPFLDHELIEFAASLPPSYKLKGRHTKYLLKKAAERLIPKEVIYRPKMGFGMPVAKWLRGEMSGLVKEKLRPETIKKRGIRKPEAVSELVRSHLTGERDNA